MNFFLNRVIPRKVPGRSMKHHDRQSEELVSPRAGASFPAASTRPCAPFAAWAATPLFIARGARLAHLRRRRQSYIDYVGSWGPLLLGHRHPADHRRAATTRSKSAPASARPPRRKSSWPKPISRCRALHRDGAPGELRHRSHHERAIRVARGFTGRDLIVKFEGCYHGHVDSLLVKAGSGMATLGIADTAGVPQGLLRHHHRAALQLHRTPWKQAFARAWRQHRRRDCRAGGRQHGLRAARARIPAKRSAS